MATRKKRDRGRLLTDEGYKKIWTAIRATFPDRQTYAAIARWTEPDQDNSNAVTYITAETVSVILNRRRGVDQKSIEHLFCALGLTLVANDHASFGETTQPLLDASFVGRERDFAELDTRIQQGEKIIVIKAAGGVGKTTLAKRYLKQKFGWVVEFPIAKETKDIGSVEALLEDKLRQLGEEPGRELMVSLDRLKRKLQSEHIGILIDNLEPALNARGQFIDEHRSYVELLRVLADSSVQCVTLITSRERLREPSISFDHYHLDGLALDAWEQFCKSRNLNATTTSLASLHHAYAGNAKAMELLRSSILEDYSGDIDAYWSDNQHDLLIEADLESLVVAQFDRLKNLDFHAYRLLVRMGCYRYQDVPVVPFSALRILLWDVPLKQHKRILKSLKDRSLVNSEDNLFWLHPVIRLESISRLKNSEDWKATNIKAAEFWQSTCKSIRNTHDAIKILESFYHSYAIEDIDKSCMILANKRDYEGIGWENLGSACYRLGIFSNFKSAVDILINHPEFREKYEYHASIYNALGNMCWYTGYINEALDHYEFALNSDQEMDQRLELAIRLNIAFCNLQSWNLESTIEQFKIYEKLVIDYDVKSFLGVAWFCLALVNGYLNHLEESKYFADKSAQISYGSEQLDLSHWAQGHRCIFLGETYYMLGDLNKSHEFYRKAFEYGDRTNYIQVKAKSILGMARFHFRSQRLDAALSNYMEAIEDLNKIGAICDLADANYELGIFYKSTGKESEATRAFQESIRLFEFMKTPLQIDKVRNAMA